MNNIKLNTNFLVGEEEEEKKVYFVYNIRLVAVLHREVDRCEITI